MNYDVVVIGGGPAGMSAALASQKNGCSTCLIERGKNLGGILNQCIHNGFGLHYFKEELTGTEYANRFVEQINVSKIDVYLNTSVVEVKKGKQIIAVNKKGILEINAKAIVLAMGCRERSSGAINLCGARPSGIYTAGMAQKLCNSNGLLVGKKIVILGSGDIGLIMARRMTYEGATVIAVLEIMGYSSGLKRNIAQCLEDYSIPLKFNTTVTRVVGKTKLEGVFVAPVDEKLNPKLAEEKFIDCDCLLLSVGLIPENDVVNDIGIQFSDITGGAIVDDFRQTSIEGFFACGNVLHVHDLVDNVTVEAEIAGINASKYAKGILTLGKQFDVVAGEGVRYVLPQKINENELSEKINIFYRVNGVYKSKKVVVRCGNEIIYKHNVKILSPGEMENIVIDKKLINKSIVVGLED